MVTVNTYINVHDLLLKKQFFATCDHDAAICRTGSYWNTDNQVTLMDHTQPAEPVMLGSSR
jgi:hypothetical protein